MKFLITALIVLIPALAIAQPIATSDQSLAWDYSDQLVSDFMVIGFDVMYNGDTENPENVIDAGMDRLGILESYFDPFPPLNTGTHIANVRACRNDDEIPPGRNCGAWSTDFTFRIGVFDAPSNVRVIDTP